jgi:predicted deacylase
MQKRAFQFSIALVILGIIGVVAFSLLHKKAPVLVPVETATTTPVRTIIGTSVQGRAIESFTYGSSHGTSTTAKKIVFVGGIHGGYEWNSVLLAYQFMSYLELYPEIVPDNVSITVIPNANPDGVYRVTNKEGVFSSTDVATSTAVQESGRFNARTVDLNRNFDCLWQATSTWRSKAVSAGTSPFSEPETAAFRDFISANKPTAVVFWHSQSNAVYASQCGKGILPETLALMNTYATASQYPAVKEFAAYATTGAADDWLASIGIPAITVELSTHESIETERNIAGVRAVLEYYGGNIAK